MPRSGPITKTLEGGPIPTVNVHNECKCTKQSPTKLQCAQNDATVVPVNDTWTHCTTSKHFQLRKMNLCWLASNSFGSSPYHQSTTAFRHLPTAKSRIPECSWQHFSQHKPDSQPLDANFTDCQIPSPCFFQVVEKELSTSYLGPNGSSLNIHFRVSSRCNTPII